MRAILIGALLVCFGSTASAQHSTRVDGWISAAGGPRVWDAVKTVRYTITTVWYDTTGAEVRRRPRYVTVKKIPGGFRVRIERQEAAGKYVQIWNGAAPWASLNGGQLPDSARAVRETQYVAGDLTYWIGLPWKLRDPGVNLAQSGDTVAVTFGSGVGLHPQDRFWYYWRGESPFPAQVDFIEQGKTEKDRERILFAEWKKVGPAVVAVKRVSLDARGRPRLALLITDVEVNAKIQDSVFNGR